MGFINIRQHDMSDCGPACLAMVARYYRGSVSIAKIREQTEQILWEQAYVLYLMEQHQ